VWNFLEICHRHTKRPAFYQITPVAMPMLAETGLAFQKLGEQAYVPLGNFDLKGAVKSKLRQSWNRGRRQQLIFEVIPQGEVSAIMQELKAISDQWLRSKNAKEKRFSLGRFELGYMQSFPVAVLRLEERLLA
jgi:phosphatidylglycerol lysyltransferase